MVASVLLGVEDVDVVGPGDAGEAAGKIALLVAGKDEDGDHLLAMVSRSDLETMLDSDDKTED